MTANKEVKEMMYWSSNEEWYYLDEETRKIKLTDKAPQRAIESFEKWKNNGKIKSQ